MIPLDKLQEMSKEELIQAHLRFQKEYAQQHQLYLNQIDETTAIQGVLQKERENHAALRQQHTNLHNAHSALKNEHERLKAAHSELQSQRPKRKGFLGLFR